MAQYLIVEGAEIRQMIQAKNVKQALEIFQPTNSVQVYRVANGPIDVNVEVSEKREYSFSEVPEGAFVDPANVRRASYEPVAGSDSA